MKAKRRVVGIILDGFGISHDAEHNPISKAKMPCFDMLKSKFAYTELSASGEDVGLPKGQMGNSEVGHLNLGAGRVVYQDYMRINNAIEDGTLAQNKVLDKVFERVITHSTSLHLAGCVSNGGVHSSIEHLKYLLKLAVERGVEKIYVHCFTDGRDTPPRSGKRFVQDIQGYLGRLGKGSIATVIGRFYAMDREERWNRTQMAYELMAFGTGTRATPLLEFFDRVYSRNVSDEFMPGFVLTGYEGMKDGDELIFFNFRPDRMRQITSAFATKNFGCFKRESLPKINVTTMCNYNDYQKNVECIFDKYIPSNTLAEQIAKVGLKQLKIAETTKYAHVTYYFNGGIEKPFKNEKRIMIESKFEDNFANFPQMRAMEIAESACEEMDKKTYDFILINISNADMVGHTGNFEACVQALEYVDKALEKIVFGALKNSYVCLITADHGNVEDLNESKGTLTTHTTNPVPFIITDEEIKLKKGKFSLDSFAPTVLQLLQVYQPVEMTGKSLIKGDEDD
ncbi:MAG: 2,3-bisphosphoglycerate-independent phosphoglycerate mutase [Clostridia bacterium]|nr:2,3-bisphosphoglycerate-independent phosphoglycerate mutase [Clostridia bacterium]